jgi:hypothetical protein
LVRGFPKARAEIEAVRRLVAARATAFDPDPREGDSNFMLKLKTCFVELGRPGVLSEADRGLLVEAGPLAHPMLSYALRDNTYERVHGAAGILVAQHRADAYAILEKALRDNDVMFKTGICHALRGQIVDAPGLIRALGEIYAKSSPNLRESVADTMVSIASAEGEVREVAYDLLTKAIQDKSEQVRKAAAKAPIHGRPVPDAYIAARLERMEKNDPVFKPYDYAGLVRLADRPKHAAQARRILTRWKPAEYQFTYDRFDAAAAQMLAEVAVEWFRRSPGSRTAYSAIQSASRNSPDAAYHVLHRIVTTGQAAAVRYAAEGMRKAIYPNTGFSITADNPSYASRYRQYLGKRSDQLARMAVEASFSRDARQKEAGERVATIIGLGPSADRLLVEAIKANPQTPKLPSLVFWKSTLETVGPDRMAAVAALARSRQDFNQFVSAGRRVFGADTRAHGFFRVVVPKAGPEVVQDLNKLAVTQHNAIVAMKFLQADPKEWRWGTRAGPQWSSRRMVQPCKQPEVLSLTLRATADPREEVAETALVVAAEVKSQAGFDALVRGLKAPTSELRNKARANLAARGAVGVDRVLQDAEQCAADEREYALALVGDYGNAQHAAALAEHLKIRGTRWAHAWEPWFKLAPKDAVELALVEAEGKGPKLYRYHATRVLTMSTDERRIGAFRTLLRRGADTPTIELVVRTVSDQYLVELGPEVLTQLRHPNATVRALATKAIERLKFYVDAKKALTGEK